MNYEKKYKEMKARVLEIGRGYVKGVDYSKPRQIAEYIDPDLKESEDERMKSCIGMCLTDATKQRFEDFNTTLKDCLAWLEKQGEQEPIEWSEEDEKMWLQIINEMEAIKSNSSTIFEKNIAQDKIDWLKSIKSKHWKPSEYDISLLEEIVRNIRNNVRPFCSEVSSLEDLIENLKNL